MNTARREPLSDIDRAGMTDTDFMNEAIARLSRETELTDPHDATSLIALLRQLYRAGRFDLALGRLFEGHIDALQIVARYGRPDVAETIRDRVRNGRASLGVWNAPWFDRALEYDGSRLTGGKAFASGTGILSHALITHNAGDADNVQLWLVDLVANPPCMETDWWDIAGMRASETHRVYWHELPAERIQAIGGPGDYERLPWFATGALRFVAVQAGGIAALFDRTRDHLRQTRRDDDPHQKRRLARLFTLAQTGAAICRDSAKSLFSGDDEHDAAIVAHARSAVADAAEEAITLAQQSVGVSALFHAHPLSRVLTDLMVYLRQPGPDAQRMRVAEAAATGRLSPTL